MSKKVNQRCVIISAYANELFAMSGWENTVCYDEAKSKEKLKGIKVVLAKWKGLSKKVNTVTAAALYMYSVNIEMVVRVSIY